MVLHLKSAVSDLWFTYNQLAEITPMPASWDVASAGAGAGSGEWSPCEPGPRCRWEVLDPAGWQYASPGFEPTGEPLFATGASSNTGGYSDPTEDTLIGPTHTSDSLAVFQQYATYTAEQLPVIWMPSAYTVSAVSAKLARVPSSPLSTLLPEYWYFTK